ncbi:hypothetical protein ESB00_13565 [Oleiharenicola lentus]|jgi:hypothetical protein|uniref:Uncharacterized protein n=1 Tax=Oleiharenicola lentus TaxID=2508720 RepID=A0A4Q1CCP8_9BACT|nr:hypothetical protein [Oleiharenicola lentus]RXK56848.1 hypothetical protein ESB00_13565 [Oleiharenicola lentus]
MNVCLRFNAGRAVVSAALLSALPSFASDATTATPLEKPFVLFMGADLEVQANRQMHRVSGVEGDAFVVQLKEGPLLVPMNRNVLNMQVTPQLKLSDRTAQVAGLKIERAYTPQNDPHRKFAAAQSGSAAQSAVGTAAGQMSSALMGAQLADQRAGALGGGMASLGGGSAAPQITAFNDASRAAGSDLNNAGVAAGQLQDELAKQLFDAVLVTCEVSAPMAVPDAYLVVVAHYRDKQDPTNLKRWIFAKDLEQLGPEPQKVRVMQGGFPEGYELVRSTVHLYGTGLEFGTNVADKSVRLTREEAHQYLVMEHVAAHKGATLSPGVALGLTAADLQAHFDPTQLEQAIYVKVSRDGLPLGVFRDAECIRPGGETLERLVAVARFTPALAKGKAVEGIAKLKLADLAH